MNHIMTAALLITVLWSASATAQPASGMPRSIEHLPPSEQEVYLQEFEMMVWSREGEPPPGARPEAIGIDESGMLGFWFFDNALVNYFMRRLKDHEQFANCPQGAGHMDCNGGCSTGLSRGYSERDISWPMGRNGFGSHGTTNGGDEYSCGIQGINKEPAACDGPCTWVEFRMHGPAELWSSRFYHPQQLHVLLETWRQYTDMEYSAPYYGAFKRYHTQDYKPLIPKTGWYDNVESEWWYAEALDNFQQNEPQRLIGNDGSELTIKTSAWLKRGNVGYQHANNGIPTGPMAPKGPSAAAVFPLDPYIERYMQLCDWVVAFDQWMAPQPARGTDAYNDIFDIWYNTRFYHWYDDAGVTPVLPATWGQIKALHR